MVSIKKKNKRRANQGRYWENCCCTGVTKVDDFGVLDGKNKIQTKSNLIAVNSKVKKQMAHRKTDS
jgi:hypothetical protein